MMWEKRRETAGEFAFKFNLPWVGKRERGLQCTGGGNDYTLRGKARHAHSDVPRRGDDISATLQTSLIASISQ